MTPSLSSRLRRTGLLALLLLGASAHATESATFGALTHTVPAGQKVAIGLPFQTTCVGADDIGTVTSCGTNYLEDANAKWTPGIFTGTTTPYYARITSGTYTGLLLRVDASVANTATRLCVLTDANGGTPLTYGITPGTTFEIVPGATLASLFPNRALGGAASAASANTVSVWGGSAFLVFYYNTTRNRWERDIDTAASPSRDTYAIAPDAGIVIQNRGTTALAFTSMGRVAESDTPARLNQPGNTFVAINWPVDTTLGRLALHLPVASHNWLGAADATSAATKADLVQIMTGGVWKSYYYDTTRARWQLVRDASNASADGVAIKAGTAVFVKRLQASSVATDKMLFIDAPAP